MKTTLFCALLLGAVSLAMQAQPEPTLAFGPKTPIALYPKKMMDATRLKNAEALIVGDKPVAGAPIHVRKDVSDPTITYYPAPKGISTGAAMIVCPGGGYHVLAEDIEGEEICAWLNSKGITAILLRYRVPRREGMDKREVALPDAQRAISYVRHHAAQYGIDPDKIGIMGFSAGGHLAASASTNFNRRAYAPFDEIDKSSCRPDYTLLIYPAYLAGENTKEPSLTIDPGLPLSKETPPVMMVQTADDGTLVDGTLIYLYALKQAGVPVTTCIYPTGGHGYGLRATGHAVNEWPSRAETWFRSLQLIP